MFGKSKGGGKNVLKNVREAFKSGNPVKNVLYALVAIVIMGPYELAYYLCEKGYGKFWFWGLIRLLIGIFGVGVAAGIAGTAYLEDTWGWDHFWSSVVGGGGGWILAVFYVWPLIGWWILKPLWSIAEEFVDGSRSLAEKKFAPAIDRFAHLFVKLPLSGRLWGDKLPERQEGKGNADVDMDKHWFSGALSLLTWLATAAAVAYGSWTLYSWLLPLIPAVGLWDYLPTTIAGALTLTAACTVGAVLWHLFEYGRLPLVFTICGAALTWLVAPYTALVASGYVLWGLHAVVFALMMAYGLPIVHFLIGDGIKEFVTRVRPLLKKAYNEEDEAYRQFFSQVQNILLVFVAGGVGYWVAGLLGLSFIVSLLIASASAVVSYFVTLEVIDHRGGNGMVSFGLSAFGAYHAATYWFALALVGGWALWATTFAMAAIAGALLFCVLLPAIYVGFRWATFGSSHARWGESLEKAHDKAEEKLGNFLRGFDKHVVDGCYKDKSEFNKIWMHVLNLGVVGSFLYFGLPAFKGWLLWDALNPSALVFLALYALVLVAAYLIYVFFGKVITYAGDELTGIALFLGTAFYVGDWAYGVQAYGYWVAVPVGLIAGWVASYILYPLFYVSLKGVLAGGLHAWLWRRWEKRWERFKEIYRRIWARVKPRLAWLHERWMKIWTPVADRWRAMRDWWRKFTGRAPRAS